MQNEQLIYLVLIFLFLIVIILLITLLVVVLKLFRDRPASHLVDSEKESKELKNNYETKKFNLKKLHEEKVEESFSCKNHPEKVSGGICLICEEAFCESCLIEHESMLFCKEHFKTFSQNKWDSISDVRTTPDTPHDALYVYHFKRKIWKERKTPTYVLTHYKINIDEDFIESFVQLFVLKSDVEDLKIELEKEKGQV